MHQRTSAGGGASFCPPISSSISFFSGSGMGSEGESAARSGIVDVTGEGNHHGGAKFPFVSLASDGGA